MLYELKIDPLPSTPPPFFKHLSHLLISVLCSPHRPVSPTCARVFRCWATTTSCTWSRWARRTRASTSARPSCPASAWARPRSRSRSTVGSYSLTDNHNTCKRLRLHQANTQSCQSHYLSGAQHCLLFLSTRARLFELDPNEPISHEQSESQYFKISQSCQPVLNKSKAIHPEHNDKTGVHKWPLNLR